MQNIFKIKPSIYSYNQLDNCLRYKTRPGENLYIFLASLLLSGTWDTKADRVKSFWLSRRSGHISSRLSLLFHFPSFLEVESAPIVLFISQSKAIHRLTLKIETRQNVIKYDSDSLQLLFNNYPAKSRGISPDT